MFENLFQDWNTVMKKVLSFSIQSTVWLDWSLFRNQEGNHGSASREHFFQQNGLVDGLVQMNILMKTWK